MKTITLVRHATAVDKSQQKADIERALTKQGVEEARIVAAALNEAELVPELILSSPATRAFETACKMAKKMGYSKKEIVIVDTLYENLEPPKVLEWLKSLNDDFKSVMVVGHDPVLSDFARYFAKDVSIDLPKGCALILQSRRRKWSTLSENDARLNMLITAEWGDAPKSKRQLKKDLAESMQQKLAEAIEAAGMTVDAKMQKQLKATAKELGGKLTKGLPKRQKAQLQAVVRRTMSAG